MGPLRITNRKSNHENTKDENTTSLLRAFIFRVFVILPHASVSLCRSPTARIPSSVQTCRRIHPFPGGFTMRSSPWILALALPLCLAASAVSGGEKSGVNDEGFVQRWLVLAPIPLKENEDGASGIAREQIKGEAMLKPKAGEKVKVDGKDLEWKAHTCPDHLLDFNAILNGQTED